MNAYGCPESVSKAIEARRSVLLMAISALGPKRIKWVGPTKTGGTPGYKRSYTHWLLDGRRAKVGEILAAAGIEDSRHRVNELF